MLCPVAVVTYIQRNHAYFSARFRGHKRMESNDSDSVRVVVLLGEEEGEEKFCRKEI